VGKAIKKLKAVHEEFSLGVLIHQHVRAAVEQAVHEELAQVLGVELYERSEARRGERNGTSLIIQSWGWRWVFYINIPVGIAAVVRGNKLLLESRDEAASELPDLFGVVLLIAGVALIALAIVEGGGWGLLDPRTLASLIGGALLFAGFIRRTRNAASPAVDLSLFSNHAYRLANLAAFVFAIAFTAMFFNFVFFLTQRWGYTLFQAGLAITPGPLVVIPVAVVAGRIADRRGHRGVLVAGGLVFAFGGALLYSAVESSPDFVRTWLPRALVTGTGVGLVLPSLSGAAVQAFRPEGSPSEVPSTRRCASSAR
jgi:MFS family permease